MNSKFDEMEKENTGSNIVNKFSSVLSASKLFNKVKDEIKNSRVTSLVRNGYDSLTSKFKKSHLAKRIAAFGLAGTMLFSLGACKDNKNDDNSYGISSSSSSTEPLIPRDSEFSILLNASESKKQKEVIGSVSQFLAYFNIRFAEPIADKVTYIDETTGEEKSIIIKPALTWDEVMSMSLVYNDFSKEELAQILNGSEIDSKTLSDSYRMAILQLMGSYVLETKDNLVNLDALLLSKDAKAFYNKYHDLFLKAKTSEGTDRLAAVEKFYDELYKDFPITDEIREEGIAHSDPRKGLDSYKFAIVPMVAASEIMFQNLDIDHTLTQQAIDYFNDIGACNIADHILEKAELVSLTSEKNEKYADYDRVRANLIAYLSEKDAYVIDDAHRDLSDLPAFQEIVNGFLLRPYTYTYVTTYTVTDYYTVDEKTVTDDRDKAVDMAGEEAVRKAEEEAQRELDKENEEAKEKAEEEADKKADEKQKEEDSKKDDLQDKVDESDKDLQDKINDANDQINNGGTVNEGDLGHGVDFDDDHSNSNGDLNDSVKDITTDGSGAHDHNDPLPDPNADSYSSSAYGASAFADFAEQSYGYSDNDNSSNYQTYEYEEPYVFTSEADIDSYINSLADADDVDYNNGSLHR